MNIRIIIAIIMCAALHSNQSFGSKPKANSKFSSQVTNSSDETQISELINLHNISYESAQAIVDAGNLLKKSPTYLSQDANDMNTDENSYLEELRRTSLTLIGVMQQHETQRGICQVCHTLDDGLKKTYKALLNKKF